jgi:hypothetical protein
VNYHWKQSIIGFFVLLGSSFFLAGCSLPGQKDFSGLQVEITSGSVSQIYLDDLHYGQTPFEKRDIRPGTYTLRVEPEDKGKKPYETQVHLYPNTLTSVLWSFDGPEPTGAGEILELEPLASKERTELSVITVPEGAKISLDTKSYGLSPAVVESVSAGQYTLSIEAVAHVKKAFGITLQPGYRLHVFSRLIKENEALAAPQVSTPSAQISPSPDVLHIVPPLASPSPGASPKATPKPSPSPTLQVNQDVAKPYAVIKETGTGWLRVRDEAAGTGEEVARVDVGQHYKYLSNMEGWLEIEYSPGKTGWISGQFADIVR